MSHKSRRKKSLKKTQKPKVNWQKVCENAVILNELVHPPVDEEIEELDPIEFLKDLRAYIADYIEDYL